MCFFPTEGEGLEKEKIKYKLLCFIVKNFGKDIRLNYVKLLMYGHLLHTKIEIYYGPINIWGVRNDGDKY